MCCVCMCVFLETIIKYFVEYFTEKLGIFFLNKFSYLFDSLSLSLSLASGEKNLFPLSRRNSVFFPHHFFFKFFASLSLSLGTFSEIISAEQIRSVFGCIEVIYNFNDGKIFFSLFHYIYIFLNVGAGGGGNFAIK